MNDREREIQNIRAGIENDNRERASAATPLNGHQRHMQLSGYSLPPPPPSSAARDQEKTALEAEISQLVKYFYQLHNAPCPDGLLACVQGDPSEGPLLRVRGVVMPSGLTRHEVDDDTKVVPAMKTSWRATRDEMVAWRALRNHLKSYVKPPPDLKGVQGPVQDQTRVEMRKIPPVSAALRENPGAVNDDTTAAYDTQEQKALFEGIVVRVETLHAFHGLRPEQDLYATILKGTDSAGKTCVRGAVAPANIQADEMDDKVVPLFKTNWVYAEDQSDVLRALLMQLRDQVKVDLQQQEEDIREQAALLRSTL